MSEVRQQRFYSYNAATNEQQDRLRMIRIPVQLFFNDNSHVTVGDFLHQHTSQPAQPVYAGR